MKKIDFKIIDDKNALLRKECEKVSLPDEKIKETLLNMVEYLKLSQDDE